MTGEYTPKLRLIRQHALRIRVIFHPSMLHSIAGWLHQHAFLLEVILVILSALAALYADTIRHFLSLPPQKLSIWVLKARLLSVNSKLFNLCECDSNPLFTLIYVTRTLVTVLILISLFLGGVFLEVVSIRTAERGDVGAYSRFHANLDISLALVFVVVVCCRLLLLGEFLYRLRNFKGYDSRLMEHVAHLEERLGISDDTRANTTAE
jgi:hypothetical protein